MHVFDRVVRTGVYPIGVHVDEVRAQAEAPANRRTATRMRASVPEKLILSVDRLDYSKGLRQRFGAFERFLQDYPRWQGGVTLMQIAPPSRGDIQTYREIRRELEAEAGRINGRFAEVDWVPLRYLNRGFPRAVLMPLYAEAQVGLVTPLRDGMNLVAKEYVAAQDPDDPGVLVLSQFAGAAVELQAALLINPYDAAGIAVALDRALVHAGAGASGAACRDAARDARAQSGALAGSVHRGPPARRCETGSPGAVTARCARYRARFSSAVKSIAPRNVRSVGSGVCALPSTLTMALPIRLMKPLSFGV